MKEHIQSWLQDWFIGRAKIGKEMSQRANDIDYFEAGWLTSMEVVEFVTEIEQHFGLQFSDHDLQDSRFVTIGGLTDLILQHSTQASKSS